MKRIYVAAFVAMLGFAAQSASIGWGTDTLYMVNEDGSWNTATTMFNGKTAIESFTMSISLFDTDGTTLLDKATKGVPTIPTSSWADDFSASVENKATYYIQLVMSGDFGNGEQTFLNTDKVAYVMPDTGNGLVNVKDIGIVDTGSTQWTAAPEPTSAMLVMLGFAGLMLKRKRV